MIELGLHIPMSHNDMVNKTLLMSCMTLSHSGFCLKIMLKQLNVLLYFQVWTLSLLSVSKSCMLVGVAGLGKHSPLPPAATQVGRSRELDGQRRRGNQWLNPSLRSKLTLIYPSFIACTSSLYSHSNAWISNSGIFLVIWMLSRTCRVS